MVQLVGAGSFAAVIINLVKIFVVIAHPRCYDASSPCYSVPIPHIVVLVLETLLVLILEVFVHLFMTFSVIKMVAKPPKRSVFNPCTRTQKIRTLADYSLLCFLGGRTCSTKVAKSPKPNNTKAFAAQLQVFSCMYACLGNVKYLCLCPVERSAEISVVLSSSLPNQIMFPMPK